MGDGVNIAARLEGVCEPGAICLSEDAYRQVSGRLDMAVTDLGPTQLKNIERPIRVYSLQVGVPAQAKPVTGPKASEKPPEPKRRSALLPMIAGIVALMVIAGGAWYFLAGNRSAPAVATAPPPAKAAHLSIVVLPFTNLSNDPAQDYFADGITENLTTDLSRIRDSFVIARNTAFTFKGKSIDAKEIGKQLGVRYVLEGSVQRDQNRVRVNAQLIDAETGAHLWADRFEEDMADLFKLQDQVVARLANSLGYELVKAEAEKAARSKNPDAVDLTTHGWALIWQEQQPPKKDSYIAARALFDQALKIDPHDADSLGGEAMTYLAEYLYGWTNPETDYDAKILGQTNQAIALDPDNMRAYHVKTQYLLVTRRWNEALSAADAGLAINPNFAPLYATRGVAENSIGRFEQAKSDLQLAMRLSPRDPEIGFRHIQLGNIELNLGHFDAAIDEYHKAIDAGFRTYIPYADLAAAYALEGKREEGRLDLAEAQRLNPQLTVKWLMARAPNLPVLFDGLRKAGLPEE
jgi:TolB-like protein/lipoprotein NlpI